MRASTFKAIATAAFTSIAVMHSASAADLAARPYTKAPAMVEIYNWTGFYIGGNAGYSWGRSNTDASFFNATTNALVGVGSSAFDMNGAIAGGQAGYNWQNNNWVWGVEADIQWSDEKGRGIYNCAATLVGGPCLPGLTFLPAGVTGTSLTLDQKLEWFGTARLRGGILVSPRVLLYGTGGLAYGSLKTSAALVGATPAGVAVTSLGSNTETRVGWTVGAGVEGMITQNWTAKLEYLYMDLGSYNAGSFTLAPASAIGADVHSTFRDHILRVGLNYKFGGQAVARY